MSRRIFVSAAFGLLIIGVIFLFLKMSTVSKSATAEAQRLNASLIQLDDSLQMLHHTLDSLKAQMPGLGEYMSTMQLHTAKLWFAGQSFNWDLASYELHELEEAIEAAEGLHAFKDKVDISAVLQSVQQTQLPLLDRSIKQRSLRSFKDAYDQTLAACNGCHRPTGYAFIHIITPTREPVTNQQWKVAGQ